MMKKPPRSVAAAHWSLADVMLIDEVADLLQRTPSRGHVIIDEAQDLSPMMLRAVGRRASTGSVTVLGDLAQATTPWATRSWLESLTHLGHPHAAIEELVAGFRVPGAVIDFAARLLPHIAPTLRPPHSIRRHRGELDVRLTARIGEDLIEAITQAMSNEGTVGVILADNAVPGVRELLEREHMNYDLLGEDPQIFDARAATSSAGQVVAELLKPIVVPASLAKGLEFDHVVLMEPAEIVAGEPDQVTGLRRLYVCLTRAVTSLVVVHATELPAALAA
jgi:DNA helicase IV